MDIAKNDRWIIPCKKFGMVRVNNLSVYFICNDLLAVSDHTSYKCINKACRSRSLVVIYTLILACD